MTTTERLPRVPTLGGLYAKAAAAAVLPGGGDTLPDREVVVEEVAVDRDHLAAYDRVCGFRYADRLPPTYLHVLAFPLSVVLMADRTFPFPLPGLVHVANRIEVHRPADAGERFTLRVRTADLRPHRKGRQFDVLASAVVDGEEVWSSTSTYLRRGAGSGAAAATETDAVATEAGPDAAGDGGRPVAPGADVETARWRVAADTGRRYGAVSGDRNPIHLSPLTSRAFGFPRPIAHGMWTAARATAALEDQLPAAGVHEVAFGKPLPLPRTVRFAAASSPAGWAFAVRDPRSGADHLSGTVTAA